MKNNEMPIFKWFLNSVREYGSKILKIGVQIEKAMTQETMQGS